MPENPPAPVDAAVDIADVLAPALPEGVEKSNKRTIANSEQLTRARVKATALLELRRQGYTRREIAEMLGMTPNAVRVALNRARHSGHLHDLRAILENDSAALAIESLNHHLQKKNENVTLETLKGLGYFRNYSHNKNEGPGGVGLPPLQINVQINAAPGEAMPAAADIDVTPNAIGTPRGDEE